MKKTKNKGANKSSRCHICREPKSKRKGTLTAYEYGGNRFTAHLSCAQKTITEESNRRARKHALGELVRRLK